MLSLVSEKMVNKNFTFKLVLCKDSQLERSFVGEIRAIFMMIIELILLS